jgi:hypothetical protein
MLGDGRAGGLVPGGWRGRGVGVACARLGVVREPVHVTLWVDGANVGSSVVFVHGVDVLGNGSAFWLSGAAEDATDGRWWPRFGWW